MSLNLSPYLYAKISPKINCQRVAQMKKYELKILCMSVYVCVYECVSIPPVFVLADVSHRSTLMRLFGSDGPSHVKTHTHTCTHTYIPDTQSNISVNETGGPLLHRVHTALSVTVTAGGERERKQSQQDRKREKRGRIEAERKGRAEEWWILLIAIVIPPCRKWLPPLSH